VSTAGASLEEQTSRRAGDQPIRIAVGTMNFGKRTPEAEALRIVDRALERGLRLFDTANAYVDGESERILGRALRGRRERALVATKVGWARIGGRAEGLGRDRVLAAFEESRHRLGVDVIDVYYLHVPDHETSLGETLGAISELLEAGRIRAWGTSNFASWQILEANGICDARGIPRGAISQQLYNLLIRQLDIEYFKFTRKHPIHTTVYNALAGGLLSGRFDRAAPAPAGSRFDGNALYLGRYWSDRFFDLVDAFRAVASDEGMTLAELAYAWLAGTPGVDSILVGAATVEQLDFAIDACARTVSAEARTRIDALYKAFQGTDATYAR
jgi:aryl-alcohol dehydrogenase-like predicted oxidoreductase